MSEWIQLRAGNTTNMTWELHIPIQRAFMHIKCWMASGHYGRAGKHPGYPVKCVHCGRTIAHRRD